MEQEVTPEYGIIGVDYPQTRGRLIMYLMVLMDAEYQQREWIDKRRDKSPNPNMSFYWHIGSPIEMIFDELGLQEYLDEKRVPYGMIGGGLKSRKEAETLYEVAYYLDPLCKCRTNDEFLSDPNMPKMRLAAKSAFEAFMENERDNRELHEIIEHVRKHGIDRGE